MEFSRPRRSPLILDLTPLVDFVFNLLLFFLLTASYLTPSVALNLPKAAADKATPIPAVVVTLTTNRDLFLNKQPVTRDELPGLLAISFQKANDRTVILRADRTLTYDSIVETILLLQRAGAAHVHLAYEEERRP